MIASDLGTVFPEYTRIFEIDSKVSLRIFKKYSTPENIRNTNNIELFGLMDTGKDHYSIQDVRNLREAPEGAIGIQDQGG